jgi:site-specific DNA-methyltransferase (adenine-specific)
MSEYNPQPDAENPTTWKNTFYNGDCKNILQELPSKAIDCIVTSPPYWGVRDYGCDEQIGFEESISKYVSELVTVFDELKRVLKDSGTVFLSIDDVYQSTAPGTQNTNSNLNEKTSNAQGSQYRFDSGLQAKSTMCIPERVLVQLAENGWVVRNKIVWIKTNPLPEPSAVDRFQQSWEPIFLLTKQPQYDFNEEITTTTDTWEIATSSRKTNHPAPLPIEVCEKCIKAGCPQDGVVLDPFCGSGSVCITAEKRNRDYVGIDINEEYVTEAAEKLGQTTTQIETNGVTQKNVTGQRNLSTYM